MTTTDWAIPQQAKLKYTQLFNLHDRNRSGFLSGLQCRDILMQSGLTRNILAEIWNLSDIDGDGQLTREEFILAMHLTNQVRAGNQLPAELSPDLIPPSYRKTRSISATSVHSAVSATSSTASGSAIASTNLVGTNDDQLSQKSIEAGGAAMASSVLNTNSFEDKRRENFEKGRAELERRRLKMIESQISVLSEQLVSWRKQLAEAKAKIDSMRSDRDTKAGSITSLEAQLQTVRDRRAFLQQEEQNLIAIAKDLNLVNSANSAELNQQACRVKEESIKQMKEKLLELKKEKEEKIKELYNATQLFEESKKDFKSVTEEVSKVYQVYKEKLAKAKVMRQQFIEENKSKPIDLDAAWDMTPSSFMTNPVASKVQTDAFGAPIDDSWAGPTTKLNQPSTATNEPFAFNQLTNISGNSLDDSKKKNNNNRTDSSQARDYSAFADLSQSSALNQDVLSTSNNIQEATLARKMYQALYAFEARNPDELTINPGDIIIGSEIVCEPGWLSGEVNGRSGLFPEAYVELLPEEQSKSTVPAIETALSAKSTLSSSTNQAPQPKLSVKYKVIYAFEARNPDELTINPGDIVTGVEGQHEPGWLMGEYVGQRGLFPEAYVERLAAEVMPSEQQSTEQTTGKSRAKKAEVATVIANYRALGQEQLNLEKGQLVLIRRKMDSGWWEGELQIKARDKSELDHLINELISSEWDYVNDLRLCQNAYIIPLSNSTDVSHVFTNWNQLIQVHEISLIKLLNKLNDFKKQLTSTCPGRTVLESFGTLINSISDLYVEFCSRQNEAIRHLETKIASDIRFKQLVNESQRTLRLLVEKKRQQLPGDEADDHQFLRATRNANLPLVSFILKPMQRITKYVLIFERMLKILNDSSGQIKRLHSAAQLLCQHVNEACRVKEDEEENVKKLRWCQSHIKQASTFPAADNLEVASGRNSINPVEDLLRQSSTSSFDASNKLTTFEHIEFESQTNCQGPRRLIKVGPLIKLKSGRELAAFLFNDLILLAYIKGGLSLRATGDLFKSERAQQAYYKVYKVPTLLVDLHVQEADEIEEQQLQMLSSVMICRPNLASISSSASASTLDNETRPAFVCFVDKHNGIAYNLMAPSQKDQSEWIRLLTELSNEAQTVRATKQLSCLSTISKRLSLSESVGRLFVSVLQLNCQQAGSQSQPTASGFYLGYNELQPSDTRARSMSPNQDGVFSNVCVRLRMRRRIRRSGPSAEPNLRNELIDLSDEHKTRTANIGLLNGDNCLEKRTVQFDEEFVQFFIADKPVDFTLDTSDFLEIEVMTDYRFRDNVPIARRCLSIDELIGRKTQKPIIDFGDTFLARRSMRNSERSVQSLISDRPTDMTFRLKPINSLKNVASSHSLRRLTVNSPLSLAQPATDCQKEASSQRIAIKLRLHLQLFSCNDNSQ